MHGCGLGRGAAGPCGRGERVGTASLGLRVKTGDAGHGEEEGSWAIAESRPTGPKARNGEDIPFSFYLKCFSNAFLNPFEAI